MVRRRSTVRFRNGAPGHGQLSNESNERRRTSPKDARQLPSHRRHPLHSKSLAATEGSRRRAARHSLVAARARSRWARRPAAEAIAASMSPSRSTVWPLAVSSRSAVHGITSAWIPAASMEPAGNEQGQDADPPVHAVRARDALQLDGLRALLGCPVPDKSARYGSSHLGGPD